jgi:3-oxoacid CoA-transferase subunit A
MATAARLVIAEVDEIVPVGSLSPEEIVTPHVYVDQLVRSRLRIDQL